MKTLVKTLAAATLAMGALSAPTATAQVSGNIAVVSGAEVVLKTTALQTAYQQIGTNFAPQRTSIQQKSQTRQTLLQQLDTNSDGNLDQTEQEAAKNTPQIQQIATLEQEINNLNAQIEIARIYAIEQILVQYGPALQTVVQQNQIQMVMPLEQVTFAQPAANISDKVVTVLNGLVPTASITPPTDWRPARQSMAMYEQVQTLLAAAQAQAAAAAQQQQATTQQPAPSGR